LTAFSDNEGGIPVKALAIRLAAGAELCAVGSVPLSAMPAAKLAAAASDLTLEQNVRWVCGRHRCWWRADSYRPRAYYSYGPSFYGYAPGWLGSGPAWYAGGYGAGLYGRWW
jgi:hypothetical protein